MINHSIHSNVIGQLQNISRQHWFANRTSNSTINRWPDFIKSNISLYFPYRKPSTNSFPFCFIHCPHASQAEYSKKALARSLECHRLSKVPTTDLIFHSRRKSHLTSNVVLCVERESLMMFRESVWDLNCTSRLLSCEETVSRWEPYHSQRTASQSLGQSAIVLRTETFVHPFEQGHLPTQHCRCQWPLLILTPIDIFSTRKTWREIVVRMKKCALTSMVQSKSLKDAPMEEESHQLFQHSEIRSVRQNWIYITAFHIVFIWFQTDNHYNGALLFWSEHIFKIDDVIFTDTVCQE